MNKETEKLIKEIVNKCYSCELCKNRKDCRFWKGDKLSIYCGECAAEIFSEGMHAALSFLAHIPWEKAIKVIANSVKEDKK